MQVAFDNDFEEPEPESVKSLKIIGVKKKEEEKNLIEQDLSPLSMIFSILFP